MLTFDEKYNAIGKKQSLYEGQFITAVKTTQIFCRPSCRARKPKAENVIFYDTIQQAIQNGFRPCKVCKPMETENPMPVEYKKLIDDINVNPYLKIKDYDLRKRGIEPSKIRRWFKQQHSITFHTYQRLLRINNAFNQLQKGDKVISTAFDISYNSLSGFTETYKNVFGASPKNSSKKTVINICRFPTKLGAMYACANKDGLCLLEFTDRRLLEWEFKDLCKRLNGVILPGPNEHLVKIQLEVDEYLQGRRKTFSVPLVSPGTDFQKQVWETLKAIPYGKTWTYQQQAIKMNTPKAVRAVATANGFNKIAFLIPCHRVIGSNGHLTGYGGGLSRKEWLINMERTNLS